MSRVLQPLCVALACAAAFAGGRALAPSGVGKDVLVQLREQRAEILALNDKLDAIARPSRRADGCGVDLAAIRADVRTALREQLPVREGAGTDADVERPEAEPQPTEENIRAFDIGRRVVDQALSSGNWGQSQADQLRAALTHLDDEQRQDLLSRLLSAINRQEISVRVNGPPF
jgi:hypothetical protein